MSTTIDQRVVEMQFDNRHFEQNVSNTISSLSKLKQSLNLSGASKGLEEVNAAAKSNNMDYLGGAVETVRAKFSALQVMGVTALANITNQAVNAGKRIVSALTIDPIKTGFQEYETQINAVQTILANTESKGTTLQQVNGALDTLNKYADKTIYNFTEMTRNIGTFTAAGVDLDTSVQAIQGIANLAAVSGSTSQQASTAMYQLSQALASGTVKLMDWNSVVNAGMGGQVFQDALKETARTHGVAIDDMIEKNGSFRETLQEGWLTSEILTETLSHFTMAAEEGTEEWEAYKKSLMDSGYTAEQAEEIIKLSNTATNAATKVKTFTQLWDTLKESAQSGWTQTWETIIGDFEEAKGFLTDISERIGGMISASADARNAVLSEGLSSGWKQLLGAGIADEAGYKDTLKSVAEERGTSIDDMIKSEKELDNTLSDSEAFQKALKRGLTDGSLTSDTLSESVHKLAGKMSEMSAEELKAAGYTQEHVTQIKALSDGLKDGSISMDEFVNKITRPSGRENIIQALWNAFDGLMSVVEPIREAFGEIFEPITGEQLYAATEAILEFSEKLQLSEEASDNLKRTFKGLFAILDIIGKVIGFVVKAIGPLFGLVGDLGGGILGVTASWGDWLVKLNESIEASNIFGEAAEKVSGFLEKIRNALNTAVEAIKTFVGKIKEKIDFPGAELIHNLLERVQARFASFMDTLSKVKVGAVSIFEAICAAFDGSGLFSSLESLWNVIKTVFGGIFNLLGSLTGGFVDGLGNANFSGFFDFINTLSFSGIAVFIAKFVKGFSDVTDSVKSFKDSAIGILDEVRGCFEAYQQQLKAGTLLKIASAIAILAAAILVISLIDSGKLAASLGAITVLFGELMGSLAIFNKIGGVGKGVTKSVALMIGMSVAVLILAAALKKIGNLSWEQMAKGLVGVLGLTAIVVAAAKILASGKKTVLKGAVQMVIFAAAIAILASVCKSLATLSWEELGKGLVGVGVLMAAVSLFLNNTKLKGKAILTATGIVILAAGIKILAGVCEIFAQMSWEGIAKGLAAVGALLAEVALFTNFAGNAKKVVASGVALVLIAAAMKIFASVVRELGNMSWEEIAKGLVALAGALLAVTLAVNFMPKNMVLVGIGLIAVGAALSILATVLKTMGSMSWEAIARGLVALGGSLALLAVGLLVMNGTLAGSAALLVAAVALAVIAPVLSLLGAMSWEAIAKGLVALAGAFVIIGVAGLVLTPLIGTILALAGAFALIGIGVVAIGAGLVLIGAGLTATAAGIAALAAALSTGVTVIVAGLTAIVIGIADLIPVVIAKIGEGILAFCQVIIDGAPAICEAVVAIVVSVVAALVEAVPVLVDGAFTLIVSALEALATYTPQIVDALFAFVIGLIDGLAANVPDLILAVVNLFMSVMQGVVDALGTVDVGTLVQGLIGLGIMAALMAALGAVAALTPAALAGVIGMGLVIAELSLMLAAVGALAQIPGLSWLIGEGGQLLQEIGNALGGFVGGIIGGIAEGITASLPQIGTDLSTFMTNLQPFIDGASSIDQTMLDNVQSLVGVILALTGANLLESVTSWLTGGSSLATFGQELAEFGGYMAEYSAAVSGVNTEVVTASANAASALAEMTSNIPNEGGVVAWFTGENSISKFGAELVTLGYGLSAYSTAIRGFNGEAVMASAQAATALAEMTSTIPNEGGVVAWLSGDNSISKFGNELVTLGQGLSAYSSAIKGFNGEAVTASANAAAALAEMTATIPNEGGAVAWFAGDNSISKFGDELVTLGYGLAGFSTAVANVVPENVIAAADAAKALAEMASVIPNEGGVVAWFTGENSITSFADKLPALGEGLAGFSAALGEFNAENVTAAASAAKTLAEMADTAPEDPEKLSALGAQLEGFGASMKTYGEKVSGIGDYIDDIDASITAASSLADVAAAAKEIGQGDLGKSELTKFGSNLETFGASMKTYGENVSGINTDAISTSTTQFNRLATMAGNISEIDTSGLSKAVKEFNDLVDMAAGLDDVDFGSVSSFADSMDDLAGTGIDAFIDAFTDAGEDIKSTGKNAVDELISGVEAKIISLEDAFRDLAGDAVAAIREKYTSFFNAGKYLVDGFAAGITDKTWSAEAKARAMARAAADAAEDELDINSPSKVFRRIGYSVPEGFAQGIDRLSGMVGVSSEAMARTALDNVKSTVGRITDMVNMNVDSQPTIRPVLDLSDVESGAGRIGGLLSFNAPIEAVATAGAINTMMNRRIQNGNNHEVVSAIKALGKDIEGMDRANYNINGVTYDDGSNISTAVKTIVRAAKIERRV